MINIAYIPPVSKCRICLRKKTATRSLHSALTGLPFLVRETVFTPTALTSLVILGVFQVAVAYILLTIGLRTTPPVTASLVSGIEPVLNPLLVAAFYGETVGPFALAGAAIVVCGVVGYNVLKARQPEKTA